MHAELNPTPLIFSDREFNRMLLGRFCRSAGNAEIPATLAPYAVDVHEDADHFYVNAELPGFTKDDVDITLEDGVLTIHAERKDEKTTGQTNGNGAAYAKTTAAHRAAAGPVLNARSHSPPPSMKTPCRQP